MGLIEGSILVVLVGASLAFVCSQRKLLDALIEAIQNFRGLPPAPMHPSPSNDGALLRDGLERLGISERLAGHGRP